VQEGTSLAFSGWFSGIKIRLGMVLYHLPDIIAKLLSLGSLETQ
jgi:hypothetical protein